MHRYKRMIKAFIEKYNNCRIAFLIEQVLITVCGVQCITRTLLSLRTVSTNVTIKYFYYRIYCILALLYEVLDGAPFVTAVIIRIRLNYWILSNYNLKVKRNQIAA